MSCPPPTDAELLQWAPPPAAETCPEWAVVLLAVLFAVLAIGVVRMELERLRERRHRRENGG